MAPDLGLKGVLFHGRFIKGWSDHYHTWSSG